jgi:hypothetical protein
MYRLLALTLLAAAPAPPVDHIVPIALHAGINRVTGFLPDGTAATIVAAWRSIAR